MNRSERLASGRIAVFSPSGDYSFLTAAEFDAVVSGPSKFNDLGASHHTLHAYL